MLIERAVQVLIWLAWSGHNRDGQDLNPAATSYFFTTTYHETMGGDDVLAQA